MMRHAIASVVLVLTLLVPADARGLAVPDAASAHTNEARTDPQPAINEARQGSGLPQQAPPPRTLREFWHVFALISLVWIGIVGYLLRSGAALVRVAHRIRRLDQDI
ncbi:MAG TPA: CcmD family protein [Longimicrobium sp.]|jgi:CcmD family protein